MKCCFSPAFQRQINQLEKKFPGISRVINNFIPYIETQHKGDSIPGFGGSVKKLRLPMKRWSKGKSGGLRIIYYISIETETIFLLLVYFKSEKEKVSAEEIKSALKELNQI